MQEVVMARVESYSQFGGIHHETAALTNVLAAQGVKAPHTDQPFSEAMLLGIGGGLGAGYILWEFKDHRGMVGAKVLVFGWQNRWQYTMQFYENLCSRINIKAVFHETGSQKVAAKQLDDALNAGQPVVAWVDQAQMPYLNLPKSLEGHMGQLISIYGTEDGDVLVDDLAAKPFRVPVEVMASARARIGSYKNRLLVPEIKGEIDLPQAIMMGLQDEIDHLNKDSDSFSLPTFQKWGKMMTHPKNAKGWPVVFADRRGLFGALASVYDGIELLGTGGGGMRGLYADFLEEAATIVDRPALAEAASHYRNLATRWTAFAETVLPDNIEPLREIKAVLRQQNDLLMREGGQAVDALKPFSIRLGELYRQYNRDFPMSDAEIDTHFKTIGDELLSLYEAEKAALKVLEAAI
jgi:hypothetical protein